ncbi:hypothetical protein JZ751_010764 [Albula glossodonta]|uniref:Uncharacterized protein n=1 Tax=Albula glossodonta TaxID=121402 RepID=A0A8T2N7G4_9TELE|nr:hypothetical protein JZ751_010764 [Albula glossodonta]
MMETAQADERAKGNGTNQSGTRRGVQIVDDEPQAATAAGGPTPAPQFARTRIFSSSAPIFHPNCQVPPHPKLMIMPTSMD